jgi:hypothetical protein
MDLIYIANTAPHVEAADAAGVDRIMVDLEILGKRERQGHLDTVISCHTLDDVKFVGDKLTQSQLMVRTNPIHPGTEAEIEAVIALGAKIVMLPMFTTVDEVATFIELVRGRAKTCLLLETSQALGRAEQILSVRGVDEVHIGLNDLHLALGLDFMFEVLAGGLLDHLVSLCKAKQLKYGFGGIARVGGGLLPAHAILMEHARLGSSQVILSRDFHSLFDDRPLAAIKQDFQEAVTMIRRTDTQAREADAAQWEENRLTVCRKAVQIAMTRRYKNSAA